MTDLEDRLKATTMVRDALKRINQSPELLSLLYDLDLMPEQLKEGSFQWRQMIILEAWFHRHGRTETPSSEEK